MIDLKLLREDPDRFRHGAAAKGVTVDVDRLVELDERRRAILTELESNRAEQNRIGKEIGPQIGQLKGKLKKAPPEEQAAIEAELRDLESRPMTLKSKIRDFEHELSEIDVPFRELWLRVPQPPADDVPRGASAEDNLEIRRWSPTGFDPDRPFADSRGFTPKTHIEIIQSLGLVDFERGVKLAGARHYILRGWGMRLHQAILRLALDTMVEQHGFTPLSVPVIVREESMIGTGFFPDGREQAYHIEESRRDSGQDLFLTGTGEVGLMGVHADEIIDAATLPLKYVTLSTCFRREAGAAGKDTAGLYRIHQFDKVEQVVICRADNAESRRWHAFMLGVATSLLQSLELPHRLVQCCTGDLGVKNEDMIDVECWMPGRGPDGPDGRPTGAWGETHSASRLGDFQCRRLNLRYREEGADRGKAAGTPTVFCHSLNNTVVASPRILIPLLEMHQQADGSIAIPAPLRPYLGGVDRIECAR